MPTDYHFLLLSGPTQQFINSGAVLVGAVQMKIQFRRTTQVQVLRHLPTDIANRRRKTLERTLRLFVVSIQGNETCAERESSANTTLVTLTRPMRGSPSSPSTMVSISSRKSFSQALPMVFRATLLHTHLLSKTNENIRKPRPMQCGARMR